MRGEPVLMTGLSPDFAGMDDLVLDSQALVDFPEPAAVVDETGLLVAANALFSEALGLVTADGLRLSDELRVVFATLIQQRRRLRAAIQDRVFDLTAVRLSNPRLRLLLASEVTVDVSLRNALVESRARYMDLVGLSGECAWETSTDGHFTMVTPKGLAGYSPRELTGSDPTLLLDPAMAAPAILPFSAPVPVTNSDVWLLHAEGHSLCFQTSAVPLYDASGVWRGARGICRDVTEDRRNKAYLAEMRHRERLFARITGIFRGESNPDDMLRVAADACGQGLAASGCHIFITHQGLAVGPPTLKLAVTWGDCGDPKAIELLLESLVDAPERIPRIVAIGPWSLLMAPTVYGGNIIGAALLWRQDDQPDWIASEAELLGSIAGPLAVAIEQRTHYHLLLDASRTDPLTSLFNRRAFDDEMRRRYHRLERDAKSAALVYVDLDNFKAVNDIHGHDVGDEALRHVADILRSNTRSTDLVARLGGDEFAVWLENADEKVAIKRARMFLAAAVPLTRYSGTTEKPLKLSIGVAVYDPKAREDMAAFVKRADAAMYQVKRSGKGSYALAPSPGKAL